MPPPASTSTLTCRGVAYDGYLSACIVFFDANGNLGYDAGDEYAAMLRNGNFVARDVLPANLGIVHIVPAPRNITAKVAAGSESVCHDIATLLPEHLPLAAPRPANCDGSIVLSPLSSLLSYAEGITEAQIKAALELPASWQIGKADALKGALLQDAQAKRVLQTELQIKQAVVTGTGLLALPGDPQSFNMVSRVMLRRLASFIGDASTVGALSIGPAYSRRLHQVTPGSLDLSSAATLGDLLNAVQAAVPPEYASGVGAQALKATANAMAALNQALVEAPSVEFMQKAMLVAQTLVAEQVSSLAVGSTTPEQFEAATASSAVLTAIQQSSLPGQLFGGGDDPPTEEDGSNNTPLIVGLAVGLGVGLPVLALGIYAVVVHMRRGRVHAAGAAAVQGGDLPANT